MSKQSKRQWRDTGHDDFTLTCYSTTQYPQESKIVFHLKVNEIDEDLTVYLPDKTGWAESGLEVPLHVTRGMSQSLANMMMSVLGAQDFKLEQQGHVNVMWFFYRDLVNNV